MTPGLLISDQMVPYMSSHMRTDPYNCPEAQSKHEPFLPARLILMWVGTTLLPFQLFRRQVMHTQDFCLAMCPSYHHEHGHDDMMGT